MPLPRRAVFAYASVALTSELMAAFWGLYGLHFLTDDAGLAPLWTGVLMICYRLWDAGNDLLIGHLSDTTESLYWGKRRGWMLAGMLPHAITYVLYWCVPFMNHIPLDLLGSVEFASFRQGILFVWYFVLLFISDAGWTAVSVAWLSLLGELTNEPQEKFSANLWRSIFGGIGSIVSVLCIGVISLPSVELKLFNGEHLRGWIYLSIAYAVLYVGSVTWCVFATLPYNVQQGAQNSVRRREWWRFFGRIRVLMRFRDVRMAVWIHVITSLTVQFSLACLAYFFMDILGTNESMMATVVLAALGCAVLTGVFIKLFFATAEKRSILRAGLIVWSTFYWILPFITEFSWRLYPAALLIGAGLGISMVIPYAMIGDVADYVEFETGERQDGLLFGILHFLNKLLLGALLLSFQLGLHFTGFNQAESEVGSSTELMIRAGLLLPMLLLSIAFWANSNYTLTRHKMNEISQVLFERRESKQFGAIELNEKL